MYLQSRIQEELKQGKSQLQAEHLVHAQALAYAEVQHDLLASTRDSVGTNVTVQALNLATLTTAAVAEASKDLTRLTGTEFESSSCLSLETSNGTTQLEHRFSLLHGLALIYDVL